MIKAYQIRVYLLDDNGCSSLERQVIALLTPRQRDELELWLAKKYPGKRTGSTATIVPYNLQSLASTKKALLAPTSDFVAGAVSPQVPTGRIPRVVKCLPLSRKEFMTCYQCGRKVTTKDDIVFVGTQPRHRNACPSRARRKS